jgi:hypothetical protein
MTFKIDIPQPCHEDWNNMTLTEKGKFCSACQTDVIDFTLMSDTEIIHHFQTSSGTLCGRFKAFQLNRNLIEEKEVKSFFWNIPKFSAAASIILTLLQLPVIAQQKKVAPKEQARKTINLKPIKIVAPHELINVGTSDKHKEAVFHDPNIQGGLVTDLKDIVFVDSTANLKQVKNSNVLFKPMKRFDFDSTKKSSKHYLSWRFPFIHKRR